MHHHTITCADFYTTLKMVPLSGQSHICGVSTSVNASTKPSINSSESVLVKNNNTLYTFMKMKVP